MSMQAYPASADDTMTANGTPDRADQAGPDSQAAAAVQLQWQQQGFQLAGSHPDTLADIRSAVTSLSVTQQRTVNSAAAVGALVTGTGSIPLAKAPEANAPATAASSGTTLSWAVHTKVFKPSPATLAPQDGLAAYSAWKEYRTADGDVYYFNSITKQRCWTLPEGAVAQSVEQQEQKSEALLRLKELAVWQQKGVELLLGQQVQQQQKVLIQQQQHEPQHHIGAKAVQQAGVGSSYPSNTSRISITSTPGPAAVVSAATHGGACTDSMRRSFIKGSNTTAAAAAANGSLLGRTPQSQYSCAEASRHNHAEETQGPEDGDVLMFIPESKAIKYLAKVAKHLNTAGGTKACTASLLYDAGIRVLRPKAGGNAHVWWPTAPANGATTNSVHHSAVAGARGVAEYGNLDGVAMPGPAAATEAIRCKKAVMAALKLIRQKPDWKQLLGIEAHQKTAGTVCAGPCVSPATPAALAVQAPAADAITVSSGHSSDAGSSEDSRTQAAVRAAAASSRPHKAVSTALSKPAARCRPADSCKRRKSADSAVADETAEPDGRAKPKRRLTTTVAAAAAETAAGAAAPQGDSSDAASRQHLQLHSPMEMDTGDTAAAEEAAAGLLLFMSSQGCRHTDFGARKLTEAFSNNPTAAASADCAEAAVRAESQEVSRDRKDQTTTAGTAAAAEEEVATPFAMFFPNSDQTCGVPASAGVSAAAADPSKVTEACKVPAVAATTAPVSSDAGMLGLMQHSTATAGRAAATAAAMPEAAHGLPPRPTSPAAAARPAAEVATGAAPADGWILLQLNQYQSAEPAAAHTQGAAMHAASLAASPPLQQVIHTPKAVLESAVAADGVLEHQQQAASAAAVAPGLVAGVGGSQLTLAPSPNSSTDMSQLLQSVDGIMKQLAEAISLVGMFKSVMESAPIPAGMFSNMFKIGDKSIQALFGCEAQQLMDNLIKGKQALQSLAGNPVFATAVGGVCDALVHEVGTAADWLRQRQAYVQQMRAAEGMAKAMVKGLSEALERYLVV